jgi:tetratricopeptide (TPR) repeat protein
MATVRPWVFVGVVLFLGAAVVSAAPTPAPDLAKLKSQLSSAAQKDDKLAQIEILRRLLDADPQDAKSHQALIDLWLDIKDYDMAQATVDAWTDAPAGTVALTHAAVLRYRDQDIPAAIKVLRDYLAKSPKDVAAWRALVSCLLTTNDAAAQVDALNALIALKRSPNAYMERANAKLQLRDYTGAMADARAAQKMNPDARTVKQNMPAFERMEEALKAIAPLDAALAKDPKDVSALLARAWWFRYGGMNDRSLTDAQAALTILPDSIMARIAAARAQYLLGQLKAEDALRELSIDVNKAHSLEAAQAIVTDDLALSKNPKDAKALRDRAYALNDAQQFLLAKRDAEAALAIDSQFAAAAMEDLYATEMLGQDPAPVYRRIEGMKPPKDQMALAAEYLGEYYLRQSSLPLALEFAQKSLDLQESERALRTKAAVLNRIGRTDEAKAATSRADAIHQQ